MEIALEKYKKIILVAVSILTVFLVTYHFTDTPRTWTDEGIFTNVSQNIALHNIVGIQTEPGKYTQLGPLLSTNYPVFFSVAGVFKIFGIGLWQARLAMVFYMCLLVFLFYLFANKRYGFYPAISSILLLISFAPFYGNGRPVQGEVTGLAFLVSGLLFLLYLEFSNFENKKLAALSGLFLGLAAATKTIYLLLLVTALPLALIFCAKKLNNKKNIFIMLGVFLLPIILWLLISFPTKELMLKAIPTIIHQAGNNGSSSLSDTSSSLVSTVFTNLLRFVKESTPILFLLLFVTVVFTFAREYFKKYNEPSITDYLILFIVIFNLVGYLIGTGWYRYFFPAHVLLYLIFPGALYLLFRSNLKWFSKKVYLIMPVILILLQFYHLFFLSGTSFSNISQRNNEISHALSDISQEQKVLFYNTIESAVFLRGGNYSQYLILPGLIETGNKDSYKDTSYDFILINSLDPKVSEISSCYEKTIVNADFLFKKLPNCKN